MKQMNRRDFIKTGAIGLVGASVLQSGFACVNSAQSKKVSVDLIKLGKSGLKVSRIAMGTGTRGYNKGSNQTRLGMDNFIKLAHHAYERGITFFDTADGYGSMPYVAEAIKTLPRKKITILTKMSTGKDDREKSQQNFSANIERFLKELGTDYIDILLLHYMTEGDWVQTRAHYMECFSKAKKDGILKAIGVSCHNIDALREASVNPWVDVIMARINPFNTLMDGTPDEIKAILATAQNNGKGVIAMKVFGEGRHVTDDEREESIRYVIKQSNSHCMTLGMESNEQIDDAVERVMRNAKGK